MKKIIKAIFQIFDGLTELLSSLCLFAMFVVVAYGVYRRHMTANAPFWTEELSRFLMLYMVMIGGAAALTKDIHPALTFITSGFKGVWKFIVDMWVELLVLLTLILLFYGGVDFMEGARRGRTAALRIYYSRVYFAVPLGCAFMGIAALRRLFILLFGKKPKNEDEPAEILIN